MIDKSYGQYCEIENMKPCPFCGSSGDIRCYPNDGFLPHCVKCDGMIEKWFQTESEAIEQWNRRDNQ